MNDPWIEFAIRIQSIAQAGLQYGRDVYDRERYAELRRISAEMLALKTDLPVEKVYGLFCNESGYQTPKVDTRAAVFVEGRVLLARENNGAWALPGGLVRCGSIRGLQRAEGSAGGNGAFRYPRKNYRRSGLAQAQCDQLRLRRGEDFYSMQI